MLGSNRVRQEIAPSEGYEESLPVVELVGERATEQRYLAQAQKNEATLIVLDKQWRELPADLPHMQARITEERREHLNLLTDAEKGPTVLLKLTEVFMLRLGIAKPGLGYGWVSDRPAAMALLETDGMCMLLRLRRHCPDLLLLRCGAMRGCSRCRRTMRVMVGWVGGVAHDYAAGGCSVFAV